MFKQLTTITALAAILASQVFSEVREIVLQQGTNDYQLSEDSNLDRLDSDGLWGESTSHRRLHQKCTT